LSKFGISNGNLVGIFCQDVSCKVGSLISFLKYGRLNEVRYGRFHGFPSIICVFQGPVPKEEGSLDMLFGIVVFSKVELSKTKPMIVARKGKQGG
jgi:hypothetical protein